MSEPVVASEGPSLATVTVSAELISVVRPDPRSAIIMVTVVLRVFDKEKWFTGRIDLGKRIFIDHPDRVTDPYFHEAAVLLGPAVAERAAACQPRRILPIPQKDP